MIEFKAKIENIQYQRFSCDEPVKRDRVKVPKIKSNHCDRDKARGHEKYKAYANSDLFVGMMQALTSKTMEGQSTNGYLYLDSLPNNVSIEKLNNGFMARVTINPL